MSNYRRARTPGGTYFFTLVTHRRKPLFTDEQARRSLRCTITEVKSRHPFEIEGVCLLPDHLHTIWKLPPGDSDYSQRWNEIKGIFVKRFNECHCHGGSLSVSRERIGEASIWQRRFWEHLILNDADYNNHLDYLHYNPVKHRLVRSVVDWPWSSFHRYVRAGVYPPDWGGSTPAKMNLTTVGE